MVAQSSMSEEIIRIPYHILRRHEPHVVAERFELVAEMLSPRAGLDANQAARHIRQPTLDLAARELEPEDDRAALIEADQVEDGLADIDADRRNRDRRGVP
jgi:hypothetical protein